MLARVSTAMRASAWSLLLVFGFGSVACNGVGASQPPAASSPASADSLSVVASFYPIEFFARRVGGERISIFNPVPPGGEPHDLELTPGSVERIQGSNVLLYLGSGFQPALDRALATVRGPGLVVQDVGEGVDLLPGAPREEEASGEAGTPQAGEEHAGEQALDPHIWLDPLAAQQIVDNIAAALSKADGEGSSIYAANAESLKGELASLDREYSDALSGCRRREIVTSHAAFAYLARRYELEQVAIAGLSPEAEPNPARLQEIVSFVRENEIRYIFFETLADPRIAELVAKETGAQTLVLNPIEGLTEEQANRGEDYFSLMRANLENLRKALECGS